jgi:hypothetical protein
MRVDFVSGIRNRRIDCIPVPIVIPVVIKRTAKGNNHRWITLINHSIAAKWSQTGIT